MNSTANNKPEKLDVTDTHYQTQGTTLSSVTTDAFLDSTITDVNSISQGFNSSLKNAINITDEQSTSRLGLSNDLSNESRANNSDIYFASTETANLLDNYTRIYDNNSTHKDFSQLILDNLWVPLAVSLFLVIAAGLLLNGVTLFMFYRNKLPRNGSNRLILSFTCSDLVMAAIAYPLLLLALVFGTWPFGLTGCKIYLYVFFLLGSGSNNSRAAIAVDRYYTVTESQPNAEVTRRQTLHQLSAAWVGAVLATLPLLFGWSHIYLDNDNALCAPDWQSTNITDQAYPVFYSVIGLAIPYLIKVGCYYQVYRRVHNVARNIRHPRISSWPLANASQSSISNKSSGRSNANIGNSLRRMSAVSAKSAVSAFSAQTSATQATQEHHGSQSRQLTKTIVLIVTSSLLAWGPYAIILIFLTFSSFVTPNTVIIASILAKSCVIYDPLVYVAFNKKFRKDFFKVLKCRMYSQSNTNGSRQRASSVVGDVPQNAGPHTRALHRYSNAKRFSVPMLSTINELESKYYATHASLDTDSNELLAQSQAQRPNAKCSLPESEIRKAQELMKGKNSKDNRDMMKFLKKSRPQRQSVIQKPKTDAINDSSGNPTAAPQQIRVQPASRGKKPAPVQQQPLPPGRKISTYHGPSVARQTALPAARKTSTAFPPSTRKPSVPAGANGNLRRGSMQRGSIDSFSSILSIISQNI